TWTAALHDGRRPVRIRWGFAQIKLRLPVCRPDTGPPSGDMHVSFAGNNGNGRKNLLQILLLVRLDLRAGLLQGLHGLSVDEEHSLSGRQVDSRCYLETRVHVHHRLNSL